MKRISFLISIMIISTSVFADVYYVDPYIRKNGTYVEGHYKTTPDDSIYNNLSYRY